MHRFWDDMIKPIFEKFNVKNVVEIGADYGDNTLNIINYVHKNKGFLHSIDPLPNYDYKELQNKYPSFFKQYLDLSLNTLKNLDGIDAVLLDGDHNWYTVFNELKIIDSYNNFPITILHDVYWPYGRRDLYYNPDTIPEKYRKPYSKKGILLGESHLNDIGINTTFNNVNFEGGEKNGVLTAIEDFIEYSKRDLAFYSFDLFNGIGILLPKKEGELLKSSEVFYRASINLFKKMEKERLNFIVNNSKLNAHINQQKASNNVLSTKYNDLSGKYNDLSGKYNDSSIKLKNSNIKFENIQKGHNKKLGELSKKLNIKNKELKNKNLKIKEMESSISWKITKPLRIVRNSQILLKLLKKNKNNNSKNSKKDTSLKINEYSFKQVDSILSAFNRKISIIIPIFNAYDETKKCIDSIFENTNINFEVIFINDCSTDNRISELLLSFADYENVKIINNNENKGFVKTVNIGLQSSKNDVLILNSDTLVTNRWLQKLVTVAYSEKDIGTVTPISNAAGAFSIPEIGKDNNIPECLTLDSMASLVEKKSKNINMEVPTGNGFCMFIKRDLIKNIGIFDEKNFGRGYGEENDFCMRAVSAGWKNILTDSTYIFHERSASFSNEKKELIEKHRKIIDKLHPSYTKKVQDFVNSKELKNIQNNVKLEINKLDFKTINTYSKKRALYVLHEGSGGTPNTTKDLISKIQNFECFLLTSNSKQLILRKYENKELKKIMAWNLTTKWSAKNFYDEEFRRIYFNILTSFKIDIIHIRHLFKHSFDLPMVADNLGIPIILSFHDFYFVCPSFHLLNENNEFCRCDCDANEGNCQHPSALIDDINFKDFIDLWREEVSKIIKKCSMFITTSKSAKNIHSSVFNELKGKKFKIIEHGRDFSWENRDFLKLKSNSKKIKILFPGNIGNHKGLTLIKDLKSHDKENILEFHFAGTIGDDFEGVGICHGKYERDNFNEIVEKINPTFIGIFSIWPETFCHTLSEAWACGIPVISTKFGALGERVSKNGAGIFINPENISKSYNEILKIVKSPKDYNALKKQAYNIYHKSTKEMAYEYEYEYIGVLNRGNVFKIGIITNGKGGKFPPTSYIRLLLPFSNPLFQNEFFTYIIHGNEIDNLKNELFFENTDFDFVIIQRDVLSADIANDLINICKKRKIKVIYEIDDDLLNIDDSHPEYEKYLSKSENIKFLLKNADYVTVSTENLKNKFSELNNNVFVIPNALDERLWLTNVNNKLNNNLDNKNIKIGYMGSYTHGEDLIKIKEPILSLKEKFSNKGIDLEFEIVGATKEKLDWTNRKEISSKNNQYPDFVSWIRKNLLWDLAIAPLAENNINESKSEIKYLEYAALGIPAIYSDVGPYSKVIIDSNNGLLVKNDKNEWEKKINLLISNEDISNNIRKTAKEHVLNEYLIENRLKLWKKIIK